MPGFNVSISKLLRVKGKEKLSLTIVIAQLADVRNSLTRMQDASQNMQPKKKIKTHLANYKKMIFRVALFHKYFITFIDLIK